jgi:hypothetical protein
MFRPVLGSGSVTPGPTLTPGETQANLVPLISAFIKKVLNQCSNFMYNTVIIHDQRTLGSMHMCSYFSWRPTRDAKLSNVISAVLITCVVYRVADGRRPKYELGSIQSNRHVSHQHKNHLVSVGST